MKEHNNKLPRTYTNSRVYPRLCQLVMTNIPAINCVCACVILSAEDDNFPRGAGEGGGGGRGVPNECLI